MNLNETIKKIVNDNSGGCKMSVLLAELLGRVYHEEVEDFPSSKIREMDDFPQFLFDALEAIPELKTLDYIWRGMDPNRIKTFVYCHMS